MGVLIHLRTRCFDSDGVGDWQLIEQGAHRFQQRGREEVLVFCGQRRNESNVHTRTRSPVRCEKEIVVIMKVQAVFRIGRTRLYGVPSHQVVQMGGAAAPKSCRAPDFRMGAAPART
jgi:hypothetical protein